MKLRRVLIFILLFMLLLPGCSKKPDDAVEAVRRQQDEEEPTTEAPMTEKEAEPVTEPKAGNGKTIYLTFDDGPGLSTQHLLAILAQYDVKATFFVTNFRPECRFLITREFKEGHTVAVHSYTHDYKKIYSSTEAFWSDYDAMDEIIYECTGAHATVMRFPGGSSNTISKSYSAGIMTTLTQQMLAKGISYLDWNVDSKDAGGANTSEQVVSNLQRGVSNTQVSVILCHDIKPYTVQAMETFIPWALEEGYTFLPCTADSFACRHTVNN